MMNLPKRLRLGEQRPLFSMALRDYLRAFTMSADCGTYCYPSHRGAQIVFAATLAVTRG